MLVSSLSSELQTEAVVKAIRNSGLLPAGLEDSWQRFGTALEDNVIGAWRGSSDPISGKGRSQDLD
jgi:hypothetical protein